MVPPLNHPVRPPGSSHPPFLVNKSSRVVILNEHFIEKLSGSFQKDFSSNKLSIDQATLLPWAIQLFQHSNVNLTARFKKSEIEFPNKSWLNLNFVEGAALCAQFQTKRGVLSAPRPMGLQGVGATVGPFYQPLNGINTGSEGEVRVSLPCFEGGGFDVTESLMRSPLGEFFPDKKISPLQLEEVIRVLEKILTRPPKIPTAKKGFGEEIFDAAQSFQISALIFANEKDFTEGLKGSFSGGLCHSTAASLHLFLDLPNLLNNYEKEGFKEFDFTGIPSASLYWNDFSLKEIPLPEGIDIQNGTADIFLRRDRTTPGLELDLNNIDLKLKWESLFGADPIELNGGLKIILSPGGEIELEFKNLNISLPSFPSTQQDLFSVRGILKGTVRLKLSSSGDLELKKLNVDISNLRLDTKGGKGIQIKDSPLAFVGGLNGNLGVAYDPEDPQQIVQSDWDLEIKVMGSPVGDASLPQVIAEPMRLRGRTSFAKIGDRYYPNLGKTDFELSGNILVSDGGREIVSVDELNWYYTGNEYQENGDSIEQRGEMSLGAKGVYVGQFAWRPEINLSLGSISNGDSFMANAEGEWKVGFIPPKVKSEEGVKIVPHQADLGTKISLRTDGEEIEWSLYLDRPQVVGPVTLDGKLKVEGKGGLFYFVTEEPLALRLGERDLIQDLEITGGRGGEKTLVNVKIGSLGDFAEAEMNFRPFDKGNRWMASFLLKPFSGALPEGENISLEESWINGILRTPTLSSLLKRPRVYLEGKAGSNLSGDFTGPVKANYYATILYRPATEKTSNSGQRGYPANFQWVFWKQEKSKIEIGPVLNDRGEEVFRGLGHLQGTVILTPLKGRLIWGGDKLGISNASFFSLGQEIPMVSNLKLVAGQLWGYERGVVFGQSMTLEGDINLEPWVDKPGFNIDPKALTRHVRYVVDRQPVSLDGFWRLLKKEETKRFRSKGGEP